MEVVLGILRVSLTDRDIRSQVKFIQTAHLKVPNVDRSARLQRGRPEERAEGKEQSHHLPITRYPAGRITWPMRRWKPQT